MCPGVQFVDDVLDFTGSTSQLGKPALNDLKSGLATAPVLFAMEVRNPPSSCEAAAFSAPLKLINVARCCHIDAGLD